MLHDAHFHLRNPKLLHPLRENAVKGIVNAQNPQEYERLKKYFADLPAIRISAGIHPWDADSIDWEVMAPVMEETMIIGEIGLDNTWCDTDMNRQREWFERSLHYAQQHRKPVIIHMKGTEQAVLEYIRRYPNTYLIHWYSCGDYIQNYMDLGCYFTVGPSVGKDQAVNQIAQCVPLDHLMIESDGLDALSWCENREVTAEEYTGFLQRSIDEIARRKHMNAAETQQQLNDTFDHFIQLAEGSDTKKIKTGM